MLPVSRSRDTYHHGDLAEALESAAMALLAHRPAAEISLREVARAANVSHNAPYHHFTDRTGLLKALAERSMALLVDQVEDAVAISPDPREALAAGGEAYVRFGSEHLHAFDVIYDPAVCVPGSPSERMAPLIGRLEEVLAQLTRACGLEGEHDVEAVWGLMHGLATLVGAGHFPLEAGVGAYRGALSHLVAP